MRTHNAESGTIYKNTNHQQMHKESCIINRNTLLHVSTLLGHLQGNFLLSLHWGCTLYLSENVLLTVCCLVFGGVNSLWSRLAVNSERTQRVHASKNQAVHSQQHILTQLQSATLV
jgi:hypothetical protein